MRYRFPGKILWRKAVVFSGKFLYYGIRGYESEVIYVAENKGMRHEIVTSNPDVDVRFYYSRDEGSYVSPHWHNSLEIVYVIRGRVTLNLPRNVRVTAGDGEFFWQIPERSIRFWQRKTKHWCSRSPRNFMINMRPPCIFGSFQWICLPEMRLTVPDWNG